LKSATVNSDKIQQIGFQFQYPGIDQALTNLTS
jgi:NAD dependent epimerase/dehydratase family enzyme